MALCNEKLVKLTSHTRLNFGQYRSHDGLNVPDRYDPNPNDCSTHGMHCCRAKDLPWWADAVDEFTHVYDVVLPRDANYVDLGNVIRSDKQILSNFRPLSAYFAEMTQGEREAIAREYPTMILNMRPEHRTHAMRRAAVLSFPPLLPHLMDDMERRDEALRAAYTAHGKNVDHMPPYRGQFVRF